MKKLVNTNKVKEKNYDDLILNIGELLNSGRKKAFYSVNNILINAYWQIGKEIICFEQKSKERADYGSFILEKLSKDLKLKYGKGFSKSNVYLMRLFYIKYKKFQTVSGKLSWSHYSDLLSIDDNLERSFYEKQCLIEDWSVRELKRQINSALFQRIALSRNKKEILDLSKKGQILKKSEDLVKDSYIFEFLNMPEHESYTEKSFEQKIIDNLQMFILELGKGFTFVKRQHRIRIDNDYYVDLVFYHRILRCFVLIDLKIGKATHQDIGQMNMYLNYFKKEENTTYDNNPIGIILAADKNNFMMEYALGGLSNKLFVSRYKLYLPKRKELEDKLKSLMEK